MKAFLEKYHATAAVSAVFLFVVVLIFGMLFTWGMIAAKQSEIEARQTQLQALQRRAAQPPPAASAQTSTVEPFLGDGSFAIAANELRQRVVALIEAADGKLVTVGTDPPVTADDETGRRVVVQAVAELSNDGLQQVLYELESAAPFVFVETLLVNRVVSRGSGEAEETQSSPRLSVDLRAAGYFRKAAP
jgi:cytoskeletal protein RodZ